MVDAGGVVIWLGSAREDLVRGTVSVTVAQAQFYYYLLFPTSFSGQVAQRKLPAAKPRAASGATCPPVDRPPASKS